MPTIASTTGGFGSVDQSGTVVTVGTMPRFVAAWLMGMLLVLPVTIWTAELSWRAADMPVVRLARWLEGRASVVEWDQQPQSGDARKA